MKKNLSVLNRNLILIFTLLIILFSSLVVMRVISQNKIDKDFEDGKKVIEDYFYALKTSDTVILKEYLGYNMIQLREIGSCNVNGENPSLAFLYNDNFKPDLISISNNTNYDFDEEYFLNDIKATNNIDAYKVMSLNVDFQYVQKYNWDFILVRYSEQSPWKIHIWID